MRNHGDKMNAIPFHASVRIRLGSGNPVKDKDGNIIGTHVTIDIKKNKVAPPRRKCELDIIFGKGISEHEYVFDDVRSYCDKHDVIMLTTDNKGNTQNVSIKLVTSGSWKKLVVTDVNTGEVYIDESFYKTDFKKVMQDPRFKAYIDYAIEQTYTLKFDGSAVVGEGDSPTTDEGEEGAQ